MRQKKEKREREKGKGLMLNDLRYAIRTLLKNPGFTVVAIVTLALGIGANTAIFSVVNSVLLRPLPYPDSDRIVRIWTSTPSERRGNHSVGDFMDLRREQRCLQAVAGYGTTMFTVIARAGEPAQFPGAHVTAEFFDVLGAPAAMGRVFSGATDSTPGERKVVFSWKAWQQLYKGSESSIGQRVRINGEPHTLVGVMPAQTEWPAGAEVWVLSDKEVPPTPVDVGQAPDDREVRYFEAVGRVKSGVTVAQASDDLSRVASIIQQRHPSTSARRDIRIARLHDEIVGDIRLALVVLQSAVGLVLLIACANVSSLLITRATGRRRELAIRAALGADRGRLVRQLLTESLLLGIAGGLAGLLLGSWLTVLLVRVLPNTVPRTEGIELDRIVALTTIVAALLTGILFGVLPALQASRADANSALKQSGERGGTGGGRSRGRTVLVVAEVALTLVLLAGAGLLLNSLLRLQRVDSGMKPENVTVVPLIVPQSRYATRASQVGVYQRLIDGLARRGEINSVGVGFPGPLRGGSASATFDIEGRPPNPADKPFANIGSVSGGFFQAMGVPLVSGRTFTESDTEDATAVGIVSAAFARKYWPGENPVGKRLRFDEDTKTPWTVVVGLAGDVRQLGLHEDPPPILYIPYQQFPLPFTNVIVRSPAPTGAVASLVRTELAAIDPELPLGDASSLQTVLDRSVAQPRFRTMLLIAFALVALVLAAVGVYGLISYSVTERTREIGIRIALGAQPQQVVSSIMREGLVLAATGIVVGLAGALTAARVLGSFLFGVGASDPLTLTVVALILLAVACLATYVPSRRALRVDPITALRTE
jgi:predicted permease